MKVAASLFLLLLLAGGEAQARAPQTASGQALLPSPPVLPMPPVPVGKLDDSVVPSAYRLDLTVDAAKERFGGRVEIDARVTIGGRSALYLHGRDLAVRSVAARLGGRQLAGQQLVGRWQQVDKTGVARIDFDQPLPEGPLTLVFEYDAAFNDGPSGMFRVKVADAWYSWTQFQSTDARAAFPAFDQPAYKTPFNITLRTPPGQMAVGNAAVASSALEQGLQVHRFAETLPLPTYLVAMMTGPFVAVSGEVPPTSQRAAPLPLRIVTTRQNAEKLDFALDGSKAIVALLEDYFGEAFPWPKLDQITTPVLPGAMENAGADLYKDSLIVMDRAAPVSQQRKFGMIVAHELAHQWFGDLVTPRWWDDIWLNESFASWMGYRIGDAWKPSLNIRGGALADGFAAMETDALLAGRAIRQPVDTNLQIDSAFDSITYGKGGHVVGMFAAYMGDAGFRDGVRRYMAAHRRGNAASEDFFAALAAAAGDPRIVTAMQGFVNQQGVPLLAFSRTDRGYGIAQSRYAPLGRSAGEALWQVPLCVRRGSKRACQLLTGRRAEIAVPGTGPLIPNADGAGYFRFELPYADWLALIDHAPKLSGGEVQAVADSLLASVLAGRGDVRLLARLAQNLAAHPDSYAADAASDALSDLVSSGVVDNAARGDWREFRGRLYAKLLPRFGFDPRAGAYTGEDPEKAQRRVQIVERLFGTPRSRPVRKLLTPATESYLAGDTAALDPAWFHLAFDGHVSRGGDNAAKALLERALASDDPLFRPAALEAVATSGSRTLARWLLEDFRDPRLRASEQRDILGGIALNRGTHEIGFQWIRANIDSLMKPGGGVFRSSRLPRLLGRSCSVERAEEIGRIFRPVLAGTPGALELERVIERVHNCGVLRNAQGKMISEDFGRIG